MKTLSSVLGVWVMSIGSAFADIPIDRLDFKPDRGTDAKAVGELLEVSWPMEKNEYGRLILNLDSHQPLIRSIEILESGVAKQLLKDVDPAYQVTVGRRESPPERPPTMSVFNVFFDNPADRPHETFGASLDLKRVRLVGQGGRLSVKLSTISAGTFKGELVFTVYAGSRLIQVEAQMATDQDQVAYFYNSGLIAKKPNWNNLAWMNTEGILTRSASVDSPAVNQAVRHRAIVAESPDGSVSILPTPHRFFFPRDYTDNLKTTWYGNASAFREGTTGLGIRQEERGGGRYSPWYNARNGLKQPMTMFLLLTTGKAEHAIAETLRYTNGDRFRPLPGHITFTSHWHMAIAVAAMKEIAKGGPRSIPDFVGMFKDMNVNAVHLAEFHGDGHPQDPGPIRLQELETMHNECKHLSDDQLLIIPGEEANVYFQSDNRLKNEGPGHWLYLFPKPIYWIMKRAQGEPFVEDHPKFGKVYRVGSKADLSKLMEAEHGLAWTAHARIKASNWTPDAYKNEDFFKSPTWLGAAWKAMPADPGYDRLGDRILDLFNDMNNWGTHKQVLGEVDVFTLDHSHELYGHMNVNYLRMERIPSFQAGWSEILKVLRQGEFFVTTGEMLIPRFTVGGKQSGDSLKSAETNPIKIQVELSWTFPLNYAEIVSGDGQSVFRNRLKINESGPFGTETACTTLDLSGRSWVRVEAWDIAGNGAFTQPVWIEP